MLKLKNNDDGFSAVELVMVIVIVGLIGVVGWMVYKNHHKAAPVAAVTVTKTVTKPATTTPTATVNGVVTYSSWSSTPTDIQKAVLVAWDNSAPGYVTSPTSDCNQNSPSQGVTVDKPIFTENGTFVIARAGCDGGSVNLVVKLNGTWKYISRTQFLLSCDDLTNNKVPTDLVIAAFKAPANGGPVQCFNQDNSIKNLN